MANPQLKSFQDLARVRNELIEESRQKYQQSVDTIRTLMQTGQKMRDVRDYDLAFLNLLIAGASPFVPVQGKDCRVVITQSGKLIIGSKAFGITYSQFRKLLAHVLAHAFASPLSVLIRSRSYQDIICALANHSINGASAASWRNKFDLLSSSDIGEKSRTKHLVVLPYEIGTVNLHANRLRTSICVADGEGSDSYWNTACREMHRILEPIRPEPGSRLLVDDPLLFQILAVHFPEAYPVPKERAGKKLEEIVSRYAEIVRRTDNIENGLFVVDPDLGLNMPEGVRFVHSGQELPEGLSWVIVISKDEIFMRNLIGRLREEEHGLVSGIYVCRLGETPVHSPLIDPHGVVRFWIGD